MRKRLCKFNGVGFMGKASGIGGGANQAQGKMGLMLHALIVPLPNPSSIFIMHFEGFSIRH